MRLGSPPVASTRWHPVAKKAQMVSTEKKKDKKACTPSLRTSLRDPLTNDSPLNAVNAWVHGRGPLWSQTALLLLMTESTLKGKRKVSRKEAKRRGTMHCNPPRGLSQKKGA